TVVFSPDGRSLATGHRDGSVTLWAVPRPEPVQPANVDAWNDLAAESPAAARAAVDSAARDPAAAGKLRTTEFPAVAEAADPEVAALIKKLDDDEFAVREEATKKLRELGAKAERPLRLALGAMPMVEARRRIDGLLSNIPATVQQLPVSGDNLRGVR